MSEFLRLKHLSAYLQVLGADVAEKGGFTSGAQDPVEAVARAVVSGVGASASMLWRDVKKLAGYGAIATMNAVEPVAKEAAAEGIRKLVSWGFRALHGTRSK